MKKIGVSSSQKNELILEKIEIFPNLDANKFTKSQKNVLNSEIVQIKPRNSQVNLYVKKYTL